MNMKPALSKTILPLVAVCIAVGFNPRAQAVPINGSIDFSGTATGMQNAGTTTLTFNNPMIVTTRTGDYSGVPLGTAANWASISWTGSGVGAVLVPNNPLWTIVVAGTTYQLSLVALSNATMTANEVFISATGIATINGAFNRDPTNFSLTVQGRGSNFVFNIGQAVPETGSAIALLAIASCGLELLRRKLRPA